MDTYRIDLSWPELDTLKATMIKTISDFETYNLYLEYLPNITKDKNNMRSILSKVELSHD